MTLKEMAQIEKGKEMAFFKNQSLQQIKESLVLLSQSLKENKKMEELSNGE